MNGLIVAFHTNDPLYRGEARRMKASADRLGLAVDLEEVASSSWLEIVRSKVRFLIAKRRDLQGPLLYVDVDAIFHADPWLSLDGANADVSFALLLDNKARSGTVYLADTQGARNFLEDWQGRLHKAPEVWDQHPLTEIAQDSVTGKDIGYCWRNLPPGLCYIFDRAEKTAGIGVLPVIEHLQASRELRAPDRANCLARRERVRKIDEDLCLTSDPLTD